MTGLGHDPDFLRLTLVHTVRSDQIPWLANGTKIAFGGFAYYRDKTQKDMLMEEYLCFVGKNATKYVFGLQVLGWKSLEYAWLMSPSGNMMEYDDGEMNEMDEEEDLPAGSESMDHDMSMTMYLVAILVPVGFCVCMCLYWAIYRACHDVIWDNKDNDPNSPMWQQHHPHAKAFREHSLRINRAAEKDDASDVTFDHGSSVEPVVELKKSNPAAQLWRQRQAEV